jgi:hypothetical protein
MRKLLDLRVPCIAKSHARSQGLDLVFFPGEEMPAFGGTWSAIAAEKALFGGNSVFGLVTRIKAHGNNVKIPPDVKARNAVECSSHAVQHLRAKHWTLIVNQRKNHRLGAKVFAKLNGLAALIRKSQVQGYLCIESLLDAYLIEDRYLLICCAFYLSSVGRRQLGPAR